MIIKNLKVKYDNTLIYDNFNLSLDNNKITCILGPSGCGKTTLLNVISSNLKFEGEVIDMLDSAYVFQSPRLINSITVKKNLEFVLEKENFYKIDEVLKMLKIEHLKDKYPDKISGGEASRVALARAILFNPKILLLDEPFKDLDYALKYELLDLFKSIINKNNLGCVYITHDIDEALYMADRIVVLSQKPVIVKEDVSLDTNLDVAKKDQIRRDIFTALIK